MQSQIIFKKEDDVLIALKNKQKKSFAICELVA